MTSDMPEVAVDRTAHTEDQPEPAREPAIDPAELNAQLSDAGGAQAGVIEAKDVSVFYGDFKAVADVSLSFPIKEISALIGPSGCGKSTTLRIIAGLESQTTGDVGPHGRPSGSARGDGGCVLRFPDRPVDLLAADQRPRVRLGDQLGDRRRAHPAPLHSASRARISSLTCRGSAFPPARPITRPTKKPTSFVSPAR